MTTITQERAALDDVGGPPLRRREQWLARFDYGSTRTVVEPATQVAIHITITNPNNYASDDAHARGVEAIGITRFPNTGISYNRLCMPSARLYEAQPIGRRGAHTVNDFERATCSTSGCPGRGGSLRAPDWNSNYVVRAYVICQNVGHVVTRAMVDAIARAIAADMLAGFITRTAEIHGHRCYSAKSCPGDLMWAWMGELERLVRHYVSTGFEEDEMTPEDREWIAGQIQGVRDLIEGRVGDVVPAPPDSDVEGNPFWYMQNAVGDILAKVRTLDEAVADIVHKGVVAYRNDAAFPNLDADVFQVLLDGAMAGEAALAALEAAGLSPAQEQAVAAVRARYAPAEPPA